MTERRSNRMTCDFSAHPTTERFHRAIDDYVMGLGDVRREHRAQASYGVRRKFLWMWTYERTADGILYLTVTLDHPLDEPNVHSLTQVSAHRFNHQVEVRSEDTATSAWLRALITAGFEFASG